MKMSTKSGTCRIGLSGVLITAAVLTCLWTDNSSAMAPSGDQGHYDPAIQTPAAPGTSVATPAANLSAGARLALGYGKVPISFEPNLGQAAPAVKFLARAPGYNVALTERGAVLSLRENQAGNRDKFARPVNPVPVRQTALRLSLVHARSQPRMVAEQRQPSYSNYFIGNDRSKWHSDVPNYGAVRYLQAYPGIDWVVYGNPRQLEYDLVVAAHADPGQIRLRFEGADSLVLDASGDLVVQVDGQTLRQPKPVIYQTTAKGGRQTIPGRYVLDHERVAIAPGKFDHSRTLYIDPTLVYSTYLGGSNDDYATAIAVDSAGNAYVAGLTSSSNFPTANPLQNADNNPVSVAFVSKLNAAGSALVYSTYLGGSNGSGDYATAIAVDNAGNAYVTGGTNSTDFPTASPLQSTLAGQYDAFITKLNSTGSALVYSTYLGGSNSDNTAAIALDSDGSVYIAGTTRSSNFPTANPFQATNRSTSVFTFTGFVTKINAAGSALIFSTYLGGSYNDFATGIAVDSTDNVYVAGQANSTDFPTFNPLQTCDTNSDVFITKFDAAGSALDFSTCLGSAAFSAAIAVDGAGNTYIAGATSDAGFPMANPFQSYLKGFVNAFVSKLNATGSGLVYSTYLGGRERDYAYSIAVDGAGNAYVAGATGSDDFPTVNPIQKNFAGGLNDAFVAVFNATGTALTFSTYLGGGSTLNATGDDGALGIALDGAGNAYLTGTTASADFPTASPLQSAYAGNTDAFVTKIAVLSTTPNPFRFVPQTCAPLDVLVISSPITVTGISSPVSISISGGQYSIDGGKFTSATGTVKNGDRVRVVVKSSSSYDTSTAASLDIGGVKGTFTVTTQRTSSHC